MREGESFVYFIQAGTSGPIKIGRAINPSARISELQTAHYETLRIISQTIETPIVNEATLHSIFQTLNIRGEWFHPSPIISEFALQLRFCDTEDDLMGLVDSVKSNLNGLAAPSIRVDLTNKIEQKRFFFLAMVPVLRESIMRCVRRERNDILREISKKHRAALDFNEFLDRFYGADHKKFIMNNLMPVYSDSCGSVIKVAFEESQLNKPESLIVDYFSWVRQHVMSRSRMHCYDQKKQLTRIYDDNNSVVNDDLVERISDYFLAWEFSGVSFEDLAAQKAAAEMEIFYQSSVRMIGKKAAEQLGKKALEQIENTVEAVA